ncbi:MFS transporter [Pseudoclavibacter endophyticus]|uniref:MFS transporter n=1 Tax=Pseudoclavibacter endophyticus TaxID=1778590 RepID=UPI00166A7B94|nr:MFS transporter [Pseudoclavibacter endophyticus]
MTGRRRDTRWTAFGVCAAVAVLTILDIAKVNVTLGPIQHTLGATSSDIQLIVAGYVLAYGIALVPAGRLGDVWNRRALFLIGLVAFLAASLVCALAVSTHMLIVGRLLQGVAAGILMPQVLGLVQQLFRGPERGRAFGVFGAAIGVGTAFGPTIGGLLIGAFGDELGWRWTFGMNVPLAIVLLGFAYWLTPRDQVRRPGQQLDLVGTSLLALAVTSFMLPFVLTTGGDDDHPARWGFLALGAALVAAFLWWERRYLAAGKTPVVDLNTFRLPSYRYGVIIVTLFFAAMPPVFLLQTLFLMNGLGHEAVVAGLTSVPYAIVSAIAAAALGRYSHRFGATLVTIGTTVYFAGLIGLLVCTQFVSRDLMPVALATVFAVSGAGAGAFMGSNQARMLKHIPVTQAGIAGSFSQVGQRIGNAIGVAIATSIYYSVSASTGNHTGAAREAVGAGLIYALGVVVIALVFVIIDNIGAVRRAGTDTAAVQITDRALLGDAGHSTPTGGIEVQPEPKD